MLGACRFNPRARDGRERTIFGFTYSCSSFNPRARDGREAAPKIIDLKTVVSIHAPVMDANSFDQSPPARQGFQSTRP